MTQHEVTRPTPLLDRRGNLTEPGWARRMVFDYDRKGIRARPFALKEWDFFQIQLGAWVLQVTIGHVSYAGNAAATLMDPATGEKHSFSRLFAGPVKGMGVSPDAPHAVVCTGKDFSACVDYRGESIRVTFIAPDADVDVMLPHHPADDAMVIATPFHKAGQFYLNSKEHFYGVTGHARIGKTEAQARAGDTALLDWGRGVWPFTQDWYWGCGSLEQDGRRIGMNIGWGFGDLSQATENMFFVDGRAIKLGRLITDMDETALDRPWHFRNEDGLCEMTMTPVWDNHTTTKLLWVDNSCHQVFGEFAGWIETPEGRVTFEGLRAFVEHARNRW